MHAAEAKQQYERRKCVNVVFTILVFYCWIYWNAARGGNRHDIATANNNTGI